MAQRRIGDVLVSRRVVSGAMVTAALGEAKRKGEKLCSVLLRHGVEEGRLAGALAELFGTPGVDLSRSVIPLDVLELVPAEVARADLVLPLSREGGRLHLAVASPETATAQVDEVRVSSGLEVSVYVAVHAALKDVIEQAYTAATRGHLVWRGKGATASGPWVERVQAVAFARPPQPGPATRAAMPPPPPPGSQATIGRLRLDKGPTVTQPAVPAAPVARPPAPPVPARTTAPAIVPPAPAAIVPPPPPAPATTPPPLPQGRPQAAAAPEPRPDPVETLHGVPALDLDALGGVEVEPIEVDTEGVLVAAAHVPTTEREIEVAEEDLSADEPASADAAAALDLDAEDVVVLGDEPAPELPPAAERAAAAAEPPALDVEMLALTPPPRPGGKRIVLVVDDEPEVALLAKKTLEHAGHAVATVGDGEAALTESARLQPDLVLLDAMLPKLHGFEVCMRLRADPRTSRIPVIIMTAVYRGWRFADDAREAYGAEDYIEKPFSLDDLRRRVDAALDRGRPRRKPPPGFADAYRRGREAFRSGNHADAAKAFEEALGIDPFSPEAHAALGVTLRATGDRFRAMTMLERAVELRPQDLTSLQALANVYDRNGFFRKAIEALERALAAAKDDDVRDSLRADLMGRLDLDGATFAGN
ncbi:MAG: response regulator [Anaeromyxobacter sp.]